MDKYCFKRIFKKVPPGQGKRRFWLAIRTIIELLTRPGDPSQGDDPPPAGPARAARDIFEVSSRKDRDTHISTRGAVHGRPVHRKASGMLDLNPLISTTYPK